MEALQAENYELREVNGRQKQLLSQTRGFIKARAAPKKAPKARNVVVSMMAEHSGASNS